MKHLLRKERTKKRHWTRNVRFKDNGHLSDPNKTKGPSYLTTRSLRQIITTLYESDDTPHRYYRERSETQGGDDFKQLDWVHKLISSTLLFIITLVIHTVSSHIKWINRVYKSEDNFIEM